MDLSLLGTKGMITMDDFVLDWTNSFAFDNPRIATGYIHRTGMATRDDFTFVETPTEAPGEQLMIETFAKVAQSHSAKEMIRWANASKLTQRYLDELWTTANK